MSRVISNSNVYSISTESEISLILSHFNSEYIFNLIEDNISNKFKYYQTNMPNVVAAYEQYFKQLSMTYTNQGDKERIEKVKLETYSEIINILCNKHNLVFNHEENQDLYSAAYYLYDFLICKYTDNLVLFFTNFILKEKNSIYESLNLNDYKKSKDSSTIYNKKIYKNPKIAIITANLEYVISNICVFDIPFNVLLNNIYQDNKSMIRFIENIVQPKCDFFKDNYVRSLNTNLRPILLTDIRLEIQKHSIEEFDLNLIN